MLHPRSSVARRYLQAVSVGLFLCAAMAAHGSARGPSSAALADLEVEAVGSGVLSWFGIDVYEAVLYTDSGRFSGVDVQETVALELRYLRNISAERLVERTRKEWDRLDRRISLPGERTRDSWLEQVGAFWPDITPGDLIVTVVTRHGPTRFYSSGGLIGEIPDPEFGPAFLEIWLHPESRRPDLRNELVGEARR